MSHTSYSGGNNRIFTVNASTPLRPTAALPLCRPFIRIFGVGTDIIGCIFDVCRERLRKAAILYYYSYGLNPPAHAPLTWNLPVILQGAHKQKAYDCIVSSVHTKYEVQDSPISPIKKSAIIATNKPNFQEISPPKRQQHTPSRVSAHESG